MTLVSLRLSLEHLDKLWVTLGGIVIPLGSLRPHALQLLPIGNVFQQHRPSSVMASGLYMGTSRQRYPGYGGPQSVTSKLYGTSYKNVAHRDQGPCKETPSLSGKVRICLHDFSMYAHTPPASHAWCVMNMLVGCSTSRHLADIFTI